MTTCFLAPDPIQSTQFIPGGNTPANGGQLFFYKAGTSTKQTVYKDNAAGTSWTNPIVLDSGGNLPNGGEVWFPTGQTFKVVFAPSNDTDPPASPYWTKDNLAGINDISGSVSGLEWISGSTPTFVSGTVLRVSGDLRTTYDVGRRIQATVTAGTAYGTITSSVFSAGSTNVGIATSNSLALDSGLSAVNYSILNGTNPSVPMLLGGQPILRDAASPTKMVGFIASSVAVSTITQMSIPASSGALTINSQLPQYVSASQCRLSFVSASQIKLTPFQGNLIAFPNREPVPLSSSGATASSAAAFVNGVGLTALAASTLYDVYAFVSSNAIQLDHYTTAAGNHSTDSATGIEVLGGNTTRAYVGKILTDATSSYQMASTTFTNGTTQAIVGVISYFNRRPLGGSIHFSAANNILTNALTEPNAKPRVGFLSFGDENYEARASGAISATSGAAVFSMSIGLDGTTQALPVTAAAIANANQLQAHVNSGIFVQPSEGSHFAVLLAGCTGNSQTGAIGASTSLFVSVRG